MTVHVVDADRDRRTYQLVREYLKGLHVPGGPITDEILDSYEPLVARPADMTEVYYRMLESLQNAGMRPSVIGGSIGGVDRLKPVLCDFHPMEVVRRFTDWQSVMDEIQVQLQPRGKIRLAPRSIWPMYCRGILTSAVFLGQFPSLAEFQEWVDFFDKDDRARVALPMLLDLEIEGLGFALACDFLKEIGYSNFAKPDVHLRDIFTGLGLCPERANDYQLFNAIVRVANHVGETLYRVDKIFWLIGSGHLYMHRTIGNNGSIGGHKSQFIEYAKGNI